jgi:diguanylate cyclase (GGDEF)-like protein
MSIQVWLLYSVLVLLAFAPFCRIDWFFTSNKYKTLFFLSCTLLFWTFITGLRLVVIEPILLYYLSLLIYPTVFLTVILLYLGVSNYLEYKVNKHVKTALFMLLIVDFVVAITNNYHLLIIQVRYSNLVNLKSFNDAVVGVGFMIHTAICYTMLIIVFIQLFSHFYRKIKVDKDLFPFIVLILSIMVGFLVNIIHVFIYTFAVDPTLFVLVIFISTLYFIFYIRDLKLIFKLNNNKFILDNFREMYLVADTNNIIVDASDELKNLFDLPLDKALTYSETKKVMEKKALIYQSSKELDKVFHEDKIYLHMKESKINMPFFKYSGRLFLFYDETRDQKLIYEMDYLMSHDMMTKLYNRNYFESMREYFDQPHVFYSILLLDLDGLKLINDFLGHKQGDDLLIRFSDILLSITKEVQKTQAIRLGGDEFMIIMESSSHVKIEEITKLIEDQAYHEIPENNIAFSYGLSTKKNPTETIANVMKKADVRLYKMKENKIEEKKNLIEYLTKKYN